MTGNEKRHFAIYAARHTGKEENIGLELFNDLERTKKWDRKNFLTIHASRRYIRHFRFHQHRLFHEILRSLHLFHHQDTVQEELQEQMHYIRLLIGKGLFNEAGKMIHLSLTRAKEFQLTVLMYEFMKLESELAREMNFSGYTPERLRILHENTLELLVQLEREHRVESGSAEVFFEVSRDGLIRDTEVQKKYIKRLQGIGGGRDDTFRGIYLREQARIFLCIVSSDYRRAKIYSEKVLELFNTQAHMKEEMLRAYIITLHNHLVVLNNLKEYGSLSAIFRILSGLKPGSPRDRSRWFYSFYNLRLTTLNEAGEFKAALEILRQMQHKLRRREISFLNRQHEVTHSFSAMICCMGIEDWKQAGKYCRFILGAGGAAHREDVILVSQLLRFFIAVAAGKQDTLGYLLGESGSYFDARKKPTRLEAIITNFFKERRDHLNNMRELRTGYSSLLSQILPLADLPSEKTVFDLFDLPTWIRTVVQSVSFGDELKSLAARRGWNENICRELGSI